MPNDIAFKVIIKNDGISDIIFKTLMLKGEAGGTISSIEKTSSSGVVDTYTITLNDGNTSTFEVTNGSNIESIEKTSTSGLIDTYTVTLTNGDTTTFEVKNGEDAQLYELPQNCVVGYDGGAGSTTHQTALDNTITVEDAFGFDKITIDGFTSQKRLTGKNKFSGTEWLNGYIRNDGVFIARTTGNNDAVCVEFTKINPSQPCIISVSGWSTRKPSEISIFGYSSANESSFVANSKVYSGLGNYPDKLNFIYQNTEGAEYIRFYFHGAGSYSQYIPSDTQVEIGSTASSYEEYCGGKASPNAEFPQPIEGLGNKTNNSYTFNIDAVNSELNTYTITASMSSPIYQGDQIDILDDTIIRGNAIDVPTFLSSWTNISGTTDWYCEPSDLASSNATAYCTHFLCEIQDGTKVVIKDTGCSSLADLATLQGQQTNLGQPITIVYTKATTSTETAIISGDVVNVKTMRDNSVDITAPAGVPKIQVDFYNDAPFPDGYEEIDFPLDDLLYYQDQEYIEFPTNWGFAMGYVFDADEVRFMINVTKDLHDGFRVVANKSVNLALSIYTGSGGGGLTGFNLVDASFIREYGQIQLRLQTETAHGLTVGSLLGARVSQGRLRITFEAPE